MEILTSKYVDIVFTLRDKRLINKACNTCGTEPYTVYSAQSVDELHKKIFAVHSALDSTNGGDHLCDLLDSLEKYNDCYINEVM